MHPDPAKSSHSNCYEIHEFVAYKCYYMGYFTYGGAKKTIISGMTIIDNRYGFGG